MLGLAAGRVLSLLLDGFPHPLLLTYLILEVIMGVIVFKGSEYLNHLVR
jgi:hypothetical protein